MGLMDKVKAQATQLAQKTQETARGSKMKFDQAQAKRRADAMLRNLGALVYAERTGRSSGDSMAQIDKLVADISAHEAEHGINLTPESADHQAGAPAGAGPPDPGSTGFPQEASSAGSPPEAGSAGSPPEGGSTGFPPETGTTQV